jgi:predicted type IV restriction endonuclease
MKTFSQISSADLEQSFGINIIQRKFISTINSIQVPFWLEHIIENQKGNLAMLRNEKAISEVIIAPVLMAVQQLFADKITVFSGEPMVTEELSGICDFLITKDPQAYEPKGGYFILVEAKKNDLLSGISQCVAEMYAAQILNKTTDTVYGCVSTGFEWLFIKLENRTATMHPDIFTITEIHRILGVFEWIIGS